MSVASAVAKKAVKGAAKKKAAPKAVAKKAAPKAAAKKKAAASSTAPLQQQYAAIRGTPAQQASVAAYLNSTKVANSAPRGTATVAVTPYKPLLSPKQTRKVGAAGGAAAITGGMVATAEQKQKSLSRAAKYRR